MDSVTPDEDTTAVERELAEAFARGVWLAGDGRPVRARAIAQILCVSGALAAGWPAPALRLTNARITGRLDLSFAQVAHAMLIDDCDFEMAPSLSWARLEFVSLRRSRLPGLTASNVTVNGHLRLFGCRFTGPLNLKGAKLQGGLLLDGAHITRPGDVAVDAERAEIGGDLRAEDGFHAQGAVRLFQATVNGGIHLDGAVVEAAGAGADAVALDLNSVTIRGGLYARGAAITGEVSARHASVGGAVTFTRSTIRNPDAVGLRLDRADVRGGVYLLNGCRVSGETRMVSTHVGRTVRLSGAVLDNPGRTALLADGLTVDGSLDGRDGLVVHGKVSLVEARITGPIHFEGALLDNPGQTSLRATGIVAGAIFNCCDGFTATGRVSVSAGRVMSRLCFDGAHLRGPGMALKCARVSAAELSLRFASVPEGSVDLRHARAGVLYDRPDSWPAMLYLDGMTYQALEPDLPPARRLDWLSRTPDGLPPQPYEELAASYRRLGHDEHARAVLLGKLRRQTATTRWHTRAWGWLQDVTVGYGYRPARAVLWLAALLMVGSVAFGLHPPAPIAPDGVPRFNPVFYTADLLLPIVSFGQETAFDPQGGQQWLAYFLIVAGWTLATTAAAGFTRAMSRS